jgi:hypothetical protein
MINKKIIIGTPKGKFSYDNLMNIEEKYEWCEKNIDEYDWIGAASVYAFKGKWFYVLGFYFKEETDAVAFKLRWT